MKLVNFHLLTKRFLLLEKPSFRNPFNYIQYYICNLLIDIFPYLKPNLVNITYL